jgi:hypothetical protein
VERLKVYALSSSPTTAKKKKKKAGKFEVGLFLYLALTLMLSP